MSVEHLLAGYLSRDELAKELSITTRTLDRWRSEGKGPAITMIGKSPVYRREAVQAWLRSCERPMPRERHRGAA